jgi:CRISPR/Cas system-associated exonuclease Cas4 (RecB family)
MSKAGAWSFSRIKAFENCPKQFYHVNVLRQYPVVETEAMRYGTEFHKACEEFIRDDVPVPPQFAVMADALATLKALPGEKYCELKLGLNADLVPVDFSTKSVWFRGIVDLLIIDGNAARIIDYKTGKSAKYADAGQLQLMALAVFKHFPQVKKVKAGLLFVIANTFVKQEFDVKDEAVLWSPWIKKYAALEKAHETGVWNPRPSGLCKRHCPVVECEHNGLNR